MLVSSKHSPTIFGFEAATTSYPTSPSWAGWDKFES